jgi:hypothetical protein
MCVIKGLYIIAYKNEFFFNHPMNKFLEFLQDLEYYVIELLFEDIVPETILMLLLSTFFML